MEPESKAQHTTYAIGKKPHDTVFVKYVAVTVLILAIGVGGFFGGIQFQKSQATTNPTIANTPDGTGQAGNGFGGGTSMRRMGGFGTVTAISSSSITLSVQTGGPDADSSSTATTKTYTITSSTSVTNSGAAATVSDITVGDIVRIQTDSSTSTTATSIEINPTFGGRGAPTNSSSTSGTNSTTE